MTKYLFSHPDILRDGGEGDSSTHLFPGDPWYERFIKILHEFIDENIETFCLLRFEKNPLGTHSDRKGTSTLVRIGCTLFSHYGIDFYLFMLEYGNSQGPVYPLWKLRRPIHWMNCNWYFFTSRIVCSMFMLI